MTFRKNIFAVAVAVGCFALGTSQTLLAQSTHLTAKNLGLGGGGTAYIDSYHANFVNPANLMLNEGIKPRFSIGLIGGISSSVGGSLVNVSVYNQYFTKGDTLAGAVASEMLDKWFGSDPGNMRSAGVQLDVIPIGLAYRGKNAAVGIALRNRVLLNTGISRGFAELGIHGLDGDVFSTARPVNMNMDMLAFHEASLGYSRKLIDIPNIGIAKNVKVYAGVAPKLLLGAHTSRLNLKSTLLMQGAEENSIDLIRHDFSYTLETNGAMAGQLREYHSDKQQMDEAPDLGDYLEPEPEDFLGINGMGWGLDLGATIEMDLNVPVIGWIARGPEKLRIGASITDLGSITFSEKAGRFTAKDVMEWRGFEFDQERIDRDFNGSRDEYMEYVLQDSIASNMYGSFAPEDVGKVTRKLPAMVNVGAQLILRKLSLSVDFSKGFEEWGTSSERLSFAGGIEYRLLGFLPLRVGMRKGGVSSTSYSAGAGIEFKHLELSIAASTVRDSGSYGSNAAAAWSGLVLRF